MEYCPPDLINHRAYRMDIYVRGVLLRECSADFRRCWDGLTLNMNWWDEVGPYLKLSLLEWITADNTDSGIVTRCETLLQAYRAGTLVPATGTGHCQPSSGKGSSSPALSLSGEQAKPIG